MVYFFVALSDTAAPLSVWRDSFSPAGFTAVGFAAASVAMASVVAVGLIAVGVVSAIVFGCMCRDGCSPQKEKKGNASCLMKLCARFRAWSR